MAIIAAIPSLIQIGEGILGLTNPNDVKRINACKEMRDRVINTGDSCAYAQLVCWSGDNSLRTQNIACGHLSPDEVARGAACGMATEIGRTAAKAALLEIDGRRYVARAAGKVTVGALKVGMAADPNEFAQNPDIAAVLSGSTKGLVVIGVGLFALYLITRRR